MKSPKEFTGFCFRTQKIVNSTIFFIGISQSFNNFSAGYPIDPPLIPHREIPHRPPSDTQANFQHFTISPAILILILKDFSLLLELNCKKKSYGNTTGYRIL